MWCWYLPHFSGRWHSHRNFNTDLVSFEGSPHLYSALRTAHRQTRLIWNLRILYNWWWIETSSVALDPVPSGRGTLFPQQQLRINVSLNSQDQQNNWGWVNTSFMRADDCDSYEITRCYKWYIWAIATKDASHNARLIQSVPGGLCCIFVALQPEIVT